MTSGRRVGSGAKASGDSDDGESDDLGDADDTEAASDDDGDVKMDKARDVEEEEEEESSEAVEEKDEKEAKERRPQLAAFNAKMVENLDIAESARLKPGDRQRATHYQSLIDAFEKQRHLGKRVLTSALEKELLAAFARKARANRPHGQTGHISARVPWSALEDQMLIEGCAFIRESFEAAEPAPGDSPATLLSKQHDRATLSNRLWSECPHPPIASRICVHARPRAQG